MNKFKNIHQVLAALFIGLLCLAPFAGFTQNVNGVTEQGESTTASSKSYVNENGKLVCWPRVTPNGQLLTYGPIADTEGADNITSTSATLHGNILHDGWCNGITGQGFQISLDADFTMIVTTVVTSPVNTFNPCNNYPICTCNNNQYTEPVTGLTPGVTYYYRAYATNDCGTGYGDTLTFTTENSFVVTVDGPTPVQFCPGGSQSATYTASVTPAMTSPTYQWHLDGVAVTGETNSTYTTTFSVTGTHTVKCEITASGLTVDGSKSVTVSTYTVPALAISAPDDPICVGGAGNLTATTGFSTYAWSSNVASSSTNTATYNAAGTYSVTATTSNGCTATASKTVTVSDPQVASATGITGTLSICSGSSTTLTANATASSGATLTYQWYTGESLISGATNASYTTEALTTTTGYKCSVTAVQDACSSTATELTTTVEVITPTLTDVAITPSPVDICSGETATMTVSATGNGTLSYQWRIDDATIIGANNTSYTTPALTSTRNYTCVVTNDYNGCIISRTSNQARVNVYNASVGTLSLAGTTVCYDEPATLTVSASGNNGTLTYQWATGGSDISGATNSSYTTPNLTAATDYTAYVTATINTPVTCTATGNVTATVNVAGPYTKRDTIEVCACQLPYSFTIRKGSDVWTETWTSSDYQTIPTRSHVFHTSAGCDSTVYLTLKTWDPENETPTTCNVSNIRSNEVGTAGALSELVDVEGHHYKVVQIGNQCWMKENLRVKKFADGRALSPAYNVNQGYRADIYYSTTASTIPSRGICDPSTGLTLSEFETRYGLMYNWYTAMDNTAPAMNMHNVQGICPDGWHLPDTTEWQTLERNIGFVGQHYDDQPHNFVGNEAIKLVTGCEWERSNVAGSPGDYQALGRNATHFSARPAGCFLDHETNVPISGGGTIHYDANSFAYTGNWAFFWSCTRFKKNDTQYAAARAAYNYDISFEYAGIARDVNGEDYLIGRSVRCVRDGSTLKVSVSDAEPSTGTSYIVNCNLDDLGSDVCTERGICYSTTQNPTIADNKIAATGAVTVGSYSCVIPNVPAGTVYYVRAYAIGSDGTAYSSREERIPPVCPSATVTDASGNTYATKAYGNKCWTLTSLYTTKYANGDDIGFGSPTSGDIYSSSTPYYYTPYTNRGTLPPNPEERIYTWGYLYNWAAANDSRGICPSGWHVATLTDWQDLDTYAIDHYGCSNGSARSLASASVESWASDGTSCAPGNNPSSNNASGFNAYPAGIYNPTTTSGGYKLTKQFVNFWTSTGEYFTAVGYNNKDLSIRNDTGDGSTSITRRYAFSIRCVKD